MQVLDKIGLETLWAKIKSKFALSSELSQLQAKVTSLETTLTSIANTVNNLPTTSDNDSKYLRKDKDDTTGYTITAKAVYKA